MFVLYEKKNVMNEIVFIQRPSVVSVWIIFLHFVCLLHEDVRVTQWLEPLCPSHVK